MKTYLVVCQEHEYADIQIIDRLDAEDRDAAHDKLIQQVNDLEVTLPGFNDKVIVNFIEIVPDEWNSTYGPNYSVSSIPEEEDEYAFLDEYAPEDEEDDVE